MLICKSARTTARLQFRYRALCKRTTNLFQQRRVKQKGQACTIPKWEGDGDEIYGFREKIKHHVRTEAQITRRRHNKQERRTKCMGRENRESVSSPLRKDRIILSLLPTNIMFRPKNPTAKASKATKGVSLDSRHSWQKKRARPIKRKPGAMRSRSSQIPRRFML